MNARVRRGFHAALVVLLTVALSMAERAAASAAIIRAARKDSSVFTDAVFGYTSASFQKAWHKEIAANRRTVLWAPIEHGKTQQVTTALPLWWLGKDPTLRGAIVGATATAARKPFGVIKGLIETRPPRLRAIFPKLAPMAGGRAKWTDSEIRIAGAKQTEKDYSLQAVGVGGDILGARFDFVILDDVLNFDNTYTAAQRKKVADWITSTLLGRLVEGARIVFCGNAWYPDDAMHVMAERGFHVIKNEAYQETEDGSMVPDSILWPEQWSLARLQDKRDKELGGPGSVEANRQLRCIPYQPGEGRFRMEWFEKAMEAGAGLTFVEQYRGPWPTYMGLDLGVSKQEGADKTAGWVMAVDPAGQQRRLLNAFEDRMTGPDIILLLADWHRRYGAVIMVENNAAQDFIRQFAEASGVPTLPFTTGKNKADPAHGVPSLGVELSQGMWVLPSGDEACRRMVIRWRTQCLAFTPGQHTGDLLMASWFAREAARQGVAPVSVALPSNTGRDQGAGLRADYTRIGRRRGLLGG